MKKIALFFIALLVVFVGCGDKVPFKEKEPLKNAALVYIYAPEGITDEDNSDLYEYSIRINNKLYLQRVKEGEYIALDLKPLDITLSAILYQVDEHVLKVSLKPGEKYYFRITKLGGDKFSFERVESDIALKEIAKTGLAGSVAEDKSNIITELIGNNSKEDETVVQRETRTQPVVQEKTSTNTPTPIYAPSEDTASKLDNIKKAYEMKKAGILSDEEFKALKEKLLSK